MKLQTIKICLLFITTLFLSCSENDNLVPTVIEAELPPISQTGENTLGFKVNDNIYIYPKTTLAIHLQVVVLQEA